MEKLKNIYRKFIRAGKYLAANRLLWFMNSKRVISLGLSDADWEIETALEAIGITGCPGRNGCVNRVYYRQILAI